MGLLAQPSAGGKNRSSVANALDVIGVADASGVMGSAKAAIASSIAPTFQEASQPPASLSLELQKPLSRTWTWAVGEGSRAKAPSSGDAERGGPRSRSASPHIGGSGVLGAQQKLWRARLLGPLRGRTSPPPPPPGLEALLQRIGVVKAANGAYALDKEAALQLVAAVPDSKQSHVILRELLQPQGPLVQVAAEASEVLIPHFAARVDKPLVHAFVQALPFDPLTQWCLLHPLPLPTMAPTAACRSGEAAPGQSPSFAIFTPAFPAASWGPVAAQIPTEIALQGQRPGGAWITLHLADEAAWARRGLRAEGASVASALTIVAVGHRPAQRPSRPTFPRRPSNSAVEDLLAFSIRAKAQSQPELLWPLIEAPVAVQQGRGQIYRTAIEDVYVLWPRAAAGEAELAARQPALGWYKRRGRPTETLDFTATWVR